MTKYFVTWKIAMRLKEKGFHYDKSKKLDRVLISNVFFLPPIYRVLEWMREEKKMYIIVEIADSGWYYTIYPNLRWENGKLKSDRYIMSFDKKESYEQAALAGIKHVLNLI